VNTVFDVIRQLFLWDDLGVSAATGRGDTTSSGTRRL
jgi:hypothetical protein